jgi:predicted ATPase with chaperone activity
LESNALNNLAPPVRSLEETGLDLGFVSDLLIKILSTRGVLRVPEIVDACKLPYAGIIDKALERLRDEHLIEAKAATEPGDSTFRYAVSRSGRIRVMDLMERNQYVGPAPVTLEAYTKMVAAQSLAGQTITPETLRQVLGHLVLSDQLINELGPAINGGRSVFIYGNTGDGKTSIGLALGKLLTGAIWIPYAIHVQGQIIKVFDPLRHKPITKVIESDLPTMRKGLLGRLTRKTDEDGLALVAVPDMYDERWVPVRRPLMVAGGELTLNSLDLILDPTTKYYEAPQQMKANGGIFLLDDLGRQKSSARKILNRWTVPLEKRMDYLNLAIGYKFQVPFDALIVFATNLKPEDLADESFLRRLRYKVHVADPTWDEFREIFQREAAKRVVTYSDECMQYLIDEYYLKPHREPRGVHGRDLMDLLIDLARFHNVTPRMSKEFIDRACQSYFLQEPTQKPTPKIGE